MLYHVQTKNLVIYSKTLLQLFTYTHGYWFYISYYLNNEEVAITLCQPPPPRHATLNNNCYENVLI